MSSNPADSFLCCSTRTLACNHFNGRYEARKSVQERLMGTEKEREERTQRWVNKKYELEDADNDSEEEFEERGRFRCKGL